MRERGAHPAGAHDKHGAPRQGRFLLQPRHGTLGEVAARGGAARAGSASGGDRGFKEPLEPAVHLPLSASAGQRLAHLVEDFVLADYRALQACCHPNQMAHRAVAGFEVKPLVEVGDGAESVKLDAMAGAQQDPVRVARDSVFQRTRKPVAFARAGGTGLHGHDPGLLVRHRGLAYVFPRNRHSACGWREYYPTLDATIGSMNRVKISVTVDPALLKVIDAFIEGHDGSDRSKVIDQALNQWSARQQEEAMVAQYSTSEEPAPERKVWRTTRRAAASRRLHRG